MKKLLTKINDKLEDIFSSIEQHIYPVVKIALGLGVAGLCVYAYMLYEKPSIMDSTVMITSMSGRGGGSGVIVGHSKSGTTILTNKHVCGLVHSGGLVKTTNGDLHTVLNYKESEVHDLCMLTVASKLKGAVDLASSSPKVYEHAIISGHPALLPNVITEGHFSGNRVIQVLKGMRECTDKELKDPNLVVQCIFFGGIPEIEAYEAVLVTATIMPGSSGSAVYNGDKELGGLVFAGSGDLGYAFIVPYEYVSYFLRIESKTLKFKRPDYNVKISSNEESKRRSFTIRNNCMTKLDTIVDSKTRDNIERLCNIIIKDFKWRYNE